MSTIKHARGDVTLERSGEGPSTQWLLHVVGQTAEPVQELVINDKQTLHDLKSLIGQVEAAAKVLGYDNGELR
jgi:hypothetical protein